MIRIIKGHEPNEWTEHKNTPNSDFEGIPELRNALLQEQGYICGYCMRRIPTRATPSSKIEHLRKRVPRTDPNFMTITMGYNNFIVCCEGKIDGDSENPHCDTLKLNQDLDNKLFPTNPLIENIVKYSSNGSINCDDVFLQTEIQSKLNLNHNLLVQNRSAVINVIVNELGKQQWTLAQLQQKLSVWKAKNAEGKFREYCGVAIYFLRKRIQKLPN